MKKKIAVYPGSFDPITLGHVDIVERMTEQFDQVLVVVSDNASKNSLFSADERVALASEVFKKNKKVKVEKWQGLIVDYVQKRKAQVIIRGLRAVIDFEYELSMANINRQLSSNIETMLVFSKPEYYFISSRAVKELAKNKGMLKGFVPKNVELALKKVMK